MVPITGENARQFLELWKEKGLKSWATMQPNWLGAFATYVAVQALEGKDVPAFVKIPLPIIDNSNIDEYLARARISRPTATSTRPTIRRCSRSCWPASKRDATACRHDGIRAPLLAARGVSKSLLRQPRAARRLDRRSSRAASTRCSARTAPARSTLINLLSGALRPDGGTIEIDGRRARRTDARARRAGPASPWCSRNSA